ncbi:hypothetical protein EMIT0232MI5_130090 [Pseudomonas sp. IT-232MI5]
MVVLQVIGHFNLACIRPPATPADHSRFGEWWYENATGFSEVRYKPRFYWTVEFVVPIHYRCDGQRLKNKCTERLANGDRLGFDLCAH